MPENRTMEKKKDNLLPLAKKLRRDMTPQERKLWYMFLKNYPVKIYKQKIIDHYIVDFYCDKAKLIIEIDGSQHYEEKDRIYDAKRTEELKKIGLEVIRFSNKEVNSQFQRVCDKINLEIEKRVDFHPYECPEEH